MNTKRKRNLQRLRRTAGYRTAADFAEASGISDYIMYERSPETADETVIPLSVAWKFADEYGVSIDEIVGRVELREID